MKYYIIFITWFASVFCGWWSHPLLFAPRYLLICLVKNFAYCVMVIYCIFYTKILYTFFIVRQFFLWITPYYFIIIVSHFSLKFPLFNHNPIRNLSSWQRREWLEFIGRPSISVEGHYRLSNHFRLFPMPEVPLSRCWPSSEMPGILCFKIVGIPIKGCVAQLSFHVFPLTNQYCHH